MRRTVTSSLMLIAAMAFSSGAALAQFEGHPNVGTFMCSQPDDPDAQTTISTTHADGTIRDWTPNGTGVGAWEPTGERTYVNTTLYPLLGEEGQLVGYLTARMTGEVSEDGQTNSGSFTLEFPDSPTGDFPPPGEWGPSSYVCTRLAAEPPGPTVGPWPIVPQDDEG